MDDGEEFEVGWFGKLGRFRDEKLAVLIGRLRLELSCHEIASIYFLRGKPFLE
jgi:hypothetical protein